MGFILTPIYSGYSSSYSSACIYYFLLIPHQIPLYFQSLIFHIYNTSEHLLLYPMFYHFLSLKTFFFIFSLPRSSNPLIFSTTHIDVDSAYKS